MNSEPDSQPKRKSSYERDKTPLLPFSLKLDRDHINLRRPEPASKIPSLTFGKLHRKQGPVTKSQNLAENDFTQGKRALFSLSSSSQDASGFQRRPFDIPSRSGAALGLKSNDVIKSEERVFGFGEHTPIPTHITTHPSSSPPIIEEQANTPLKFMSYSQMVNTAPRFDTREQGTSQAARSTRTGMRKRFSSTSSLAS
jgi:hypothetical protein